MTTANERRQNTRVEFATSVDLSCNKENYLNCKTENLSTNGIFIFGTYELEITQSCDITLNLTGGHDLILKMTGKVQRITPEGIGIQFTEIDLDSFTHLKNIIHYNSENPDIINEKY